MKGIAFQTISALDHTSPIIVVFTWTSDNRKTGDMPQSWILMEYVDPVIAWQRGKDSGICGNCKLRYGEKPPCYVVKGHAPLAIYKAYHKGRYRLVDGDGPDDLPFEDAIELINMFPGRFGAYGDPAAAPDIFCRLRSVTGYTHQWDHPIMDEIGDDMRRQNMASVETFYEKRKANAKGWRTYRIVTSVSELDVDEVMCPWNKDQWRKFQCRDCRLCGGSKIPHKNIAVLPLGKEHH